MRCFFPIQYETIWTHKELLTLFENIIVMFLQHIKTIIIFTLSKIRNNSKFITCAEAVAQIWLFICCKTKLKKNIFFVEKMFFTKYKLFAEKMFLYGKKSFILKFFFTEKNFFYWEKYKWKCKNIIYLIWEISFYAENVCVTNNLS